MAEWLQILIKSITLIFVLFLFTKWLGKKQISQLNIFQYITGFVLGGIVAITSVDPKANIFYGLISMFVWFIFPFSIDFLSLKNKRIRDFFLGKSTVFIQNGKIIEGNLKKERFSTDDLLQHLRYNNMFKTSDVEFAILEPSGTLNVLPKSAHKPLTAYDLNITLAHENEPKTVIMDGDMIIESLTDIGLNASWLKAELTKRNIDLNNVFLAQVDSNGQLFVDLYKNKETPAANSQSLLLVATLRKIHADLELLALATEDNPSKQMYEKNCTKVNEMMQLVHTTLK